MIKRVTLTIITILIFSLNCYAEGQEGLQEIYNIGYFFGVFLFFSIHTIIGGMIIKLVLQKKNLLINNQTLKAFSISFLISIFATIIFGDNFIFLLWNLF